MRIQIFLGLLGASLLVGCASPLQQAERAARIQQANTPFQEKVSVPFDEAQAHKAMEPGPTTIKGVLYHKVTMGGRYAGEDTTITLNPPRHLRGIKLVLYPASAHLTELLRLERENRRERAFSKTAQLKHFVPDARMARYGLFTRTDEHGRYTFKGLKPGKYHLIAENVDISSSGTEVVVTGTSVVSNGIFAAPVTHYGARNFRVKTLVEYDDEIEVPPGQQEVTVESRMRFISNSSLLF